VGSAILQNHDSILLAATGLLLRVDEKLATLQQELPNSEEQQLLRNQTIFDYEDLKARVEALIALWSRPSAAVLEETAYSKPQRHLSPL